MQEYDIIIAGAGASGVFMAYELTKNKNNARVLMIDRGAQILEDDMEEEPVEGKFSA